MPMKVTAMQSRTPIRRGVPHEYTAEQRAALDRARKPSREMNRISLQRHEPANRDRIIPINARLGITAR